MKSREGADASASRMLTAGIGGREDPCEGGPKQRRRTIGQKHDMNLMRLFALQQQKSWTYHEEDTDFVEQTGSLVSRLDGRFDRESTGSDDDGEGDPEATVRRESGRTKGVAHGHFPA